MRAFEAENTVTYHEVGGFEPGRQPGEKKPTDNRPDREKQKGEKEEVMLGTFSRNASRQNAQPDLLLPTSRRAPSR